MITAGFISPAGKITEALFHSTACKGSKNLTKLLKTAIRFRIYENHVVFETLAKSITIEQKTALNKYLRYYQDYTFVCSINREVVSATGFISKMSLRKLRQFINMKVQV